MNNESYRLNRIQNTPANDGQAPVITVNTSNADPAISIDDEGNLIYNNNSILYFNPGSNVVYTGLEVRSIPEGWRFKQLYLTPGNSLIFISEDLSRLNVINLEANSDELIYKDEVICKLQIEKDKNFAINWWIN